MFSMMETLIIEENVGEFPILHNGWVLHQKGWEYTVSIYSWIVAIVEAKRPESWNANEIRGYNDWEEVVK